MYNPSKFNKSKTTTFELNKSAISGKSKLHNTALAILKSEDFKAKRSRLESVLQQQYIIKYGSKQVNSKINNAIKSEIDFYLNKFENIKGAEANLMKLEEQIKSVTQKLKDDKEIKNFSVSQESVSVGNTSNNFDMVDPSITNKSKKEFDAKNWLVFNAIIDVTDEEKHNEKQRENFRRKNQFRKSLDEQLDLMQKSRKNQLEEKERLHDILVMEEVNYKNEVVENRKKKLDDYQIDKAKRGNIYTVVKFLLHKCIVY